jgi:hypothetical protein
VDDETWARGRGWALWKTLVACAVALESGGPELAVAELVLEQILQEYAPQRS